MRNHFKKIIFSLVAAVFFSANAGSYDDFFAAIQRDDARTVQTLLQRGFDPNTLSPKGQHGLLLAVREPSPRVVQTLLDWPKTEAESVSPDGETPLMLASLQGNLPLVKRLIEREAHVNKTGWTALHYAATNGHVEVMRLLLENHAYIDAESPNQTTPLMMAAHYGTTEAVKLLLEEGADATLKNEKGLTAIDFAQSANKTAASEAIAAFLRQKQPKGQW